MIFQGCMIQAAVKVARMTPRLRMTYLGNRQQMSLAQLMTLADRFVPTCATTQVRPTKKAPHRPAGPSHWAASVRGSQMYSPSVAAWLAVELQVPAVFKKRDRRSALVNTDP